MTRATFDRVCIMTPGRIRNRSQIVERTSRTRVDQTGYPRRVPTSKRIGRRDSYALACTRV